MYYFILLIILIKIQMHYTLNTFIFGRCIEKKLKLINDDVVIKIITIDS